MARIPMDMKEIYEARRAGISEYVIDKIAKGYKISSVERDIVNRHGKSYVESHKRDGKWVKPQLRDLPKGKKVLSRASLDERNIEGLPDNWAYPETPKEEEKIMDWDLDTFEDVKDTAQRMGSLRMIGLFDRLAIGKERSTDGLDLYKISIGKNPYRDDKIPQYMQDWAHYSLTVSSPRGYRYAKEAYQTEKE